MSSDVDAMIDRRRLKQRVRFWRIVAVIAVIALVFFFFGRSSMELKPYVARVTVEGVILEDTRLESILDTVARDSNAKALVVRINSPGGTTAGSEALYHALREVAKEKPVVATMGTLAASGGYITAIAADHIVARETTLTGSIGVIFEYAQVGELLKKIGIEMETVKSAPLKGEPSMTKPLTPEGKAALEAIINDSYDWFVDLVTERRGLPRDTVVGLADGRVYTGRQAVQNKLVDSLGGEREARQWLLAERDVALDLTTVDVDLSPRDRLLQEIVGGAIQKVLSSERLTLDGLVSVWHPTD